MPQTKTDIVNRALLYLGAQPVTDFDTDTSDKGTLVRSFYDKCRQDTLRGFPWHCAQVVKELFAYEERVGSITPASTAVATGVVFTITAGIIVAADVGKRLFNVGFQGKATVRSISDPTHIVADIYETWYNTSTRTNTVVGPVANVPSTAQWRLYTVQPDHTWEFAITLPTDYIRDVLDNAEEDLNYKVKGGLVYTDDSSIDFEYVKDLSDVTLFTPGFQTALEYLLAHRLAIPVVNKVEFSKLYMELYKAALAEARSLESQEGVPSDTGSNILGTVRNFNTRDPWKRIGIGSTT